MWNRRTIAFALGSCCAVYCRGRCVQWGLQQFSETHIGREEFRQLRPGMTEADINAVLGLQPTISKRHETRTIDLNQWESFPEGLDEERVEGEFPKSVGLRNGGCLCGVYTRRASSLFCLCCV